ncbi:hypothetical protein J3R83DRAFT_6084 [Lanmaoa asiatica]|nr:hypothetical protein J3R83DRAFT_6084 [Lanmaoa asiatica]
MKVNWFSQLSLYVFYLLPFLCHEVAANTEIINFSSSGEQTVDLPLAVVGNWSKLYSSDNERRWTLEPAALHTPLHQVCERDDKTVPSHHPPFSCPHELWLLLDLDDEKWASHSTFTLRLSWPASTPADFTIAIYTPQDLLARLSEPDLIETGPGRESTHGRSSPHTSSTAHTPTTRSRYARIRVVRAGVPIPSVRSQSSPPVSIPPLPRVPVPVPILISRPGSDATPANLAVDERGKETAPFVVILEPLYLGVLPATLLPTVGFLIPVVFAAVLSVPWVTAYFEPFIRQARKDLNTNKER